MARPREELFEAGNQVTLVDLDGGSKLNGAVGKLLRSLGRGRWTVTLEGRNRSVVLDEKNLKRYVEPAASPPSTALSSKPAPYHIIGTWDDWEPHEMDWNAGLSCFEINVRLGNEAVESFQFLVDEDWECCVYPDCVGASCYTRHSICGPDDGGEGTEWTIGLHEADRAEPGTFYKVRAFVAAGGEPLRVTWWQLDDPPDEANKAPTVKGKDAAAPAARSRCEDECDRAAVARAERAMWRRVERKVADQQRAIIEARLAENRRRYVAHSGTQRERVRQTLNTVSPDAAADLTSGTQGERALQSENTVSQDAAVNPKGPQVCAVVAADSQPLRIAGNESNHFAEYSDDSQAPAVKREKTAPPKMDKVAAERAAWYRLDRRLREAAKKAEMQAITAAAEGTPQVADLERVAIDARLAENRRRYVAHSGTQEERVQQTLNTVSPEAAVKLMPSEPGQFERRQGKCMECDIMTDIVVGVGVFCCEVCLSLYREICRDGWDGSVLIEGQPAAQHAQKLVDETPRGCTLTISVARRLVMKDFPQYFKRQTADRATFP